MRWLMIAVVCLLCCGVVPAAVEFDEVDDRVEIPDHDELDLSLPVSFCAWINPDDLGQGSNGRIIDHGGGAGADGWSFQLASTNRLQVYFNGGSGTGNRASNNSVVTLNVWQHVCASFTTTDHTFYVDGVSAGTSTVDPPAIAAETDAVWIGARSSDANREFDGEIDHVAIFDVALSSDDVNDLFADPYSRIGDCVAHWPLDGNGAQVNICSGGAAHAGTIVNATHAPTSSPIGPYMASHAGHFEAAVAGAPRRRQNVILGSLMWPGIVVGALLLVALVRRRR